MCGPSWSTSRNDRNESFLSCHERKDFLKSLDKWNDGELLFDAAAVVVEEEEVGKKQPAKRNFFSSSFWI